jgi:hypothetical protein
MVDSLYEKKFGDVGQAIVDTGEAIADGISGAASAVAGGVKDAWNAIF